MGSAFHKSAAKLELETISSSPTENVFRVENFDALEKIRATLQAKLFAIEGKVMMVKMSLKYQPAYNFSQSMDFFELHCI